MKKTFLISILIFTANLAFSLEAKVISTKGKTEVQNGNVWISLKEGDTLSKGSVIQTGFKSELVLKINESTVTVTPLSRLTIEQLAEVKSGTDAASHDETKLFLDTGSLKSNVKKSEDKRVSFTVHSQVATAAVRGTELSVKQVYRATNVTTHNGKVAVWKTKDSHPSIADGTNLSQTEEDSFETSPQGSFLSTKGNTVTFNASGNIVSAQANARKTSGAAKTPLSSGRETSQGSGRVSDGTTEKTLSIIIYRAD